MCHRNELYEFPASIETSHWVTRDASAYNRDLQSALMERHVEDDTVFQQLCDAMFFDGRSDVYAGLILRHDFAPLRSPKGSRLLEHGQVVDLQCRPTVACSFDTHVLQF